MESRPAGEASLLREAEQEPDPADAAFFGRSYVMQQVAPRVWGEEGSREELLLFAALALFDAQGAIPWRGCRDHVERALVHLHAVGEQKAAEQLRDDVAQTAHEEPNQIVDQLRARSLGHARSAVDVTRHAPRWVRTGGGAFHSNPLQGDPAVDVLCPP